MAAHNGSKITTIKELEWANNPTKNITVSPGHIEIDWGKLSELSAYEPVKTAFKEKLNYKKDSFFGLSVVGGSFRHIIHPLVFYADDGPAQQMLA